MKIINRETIATNKSIYIICTFEDGSVRKYNQESRIWNDVEPSTAFLEEDYSKANNSA